MLEKFDDLNGAILSAIENKDNEALIFTLDNGEKYSLHHDQHCCESVGIEDIIGDLSDLVGSPILMAEEASQNTNPTDVAKEDQESFTWTFYKLATIKGYVTIRWWSDAEISAEQKRRMIRRAIHFNRNADGSLTEIGKWYAGK